MKDGDLLATKLDNIVLEGRKIFANLPRFHRVVKEDVIPVVRQGRLGKEEVAVQGGEGFCQRSSREGTTIDFMLKC